MCAILPILSSSAGGCARRCRCQPLWQSSPHPVARIPLLLCPGSQVALSWIAGHPGRWVANSVLRGVRLLPLLLAWDGGVGREPTVRETPQRALPFPSHLTTQGMRASASPNATQLQAHRWGACPFDVPTVCHQESLGPHKAKLGAGGEHSLERALRADGVSEARIGFGDDFARS